ncbi:transcriptional regulator, TetR family [Andreprevotia lacus DSM 23236]|jgi:AcrR family transcriptional regulator|uniref:Transcriptional regulator, TetR family n=1 Tax=Andreprevotia lacus DSM 23236 TaxID=1121001 RepID=A0A1W1XIY6_9NEIS|nr:TetR/AcrR family transcriptional regulator [Andreprevotia lacus]SMC23797.1 transcriptional regulator, TetR family [Andreprevotia lacus DSM 23236]
MNATPAHPGDSVDRVLEAARQLFCEEGFRASIDKVAERAGVARQTVYNRFGSKTELFRAVIQRVCTDLHETLEARDGALREQLIDFSLHFRAHVMSAENISAHRALVAEVPRFPELANALLENGPCRTRDQLAALLSHEMSAGRLLVADPIEAAEFLLEVVVGFDHTRILFGGLPPLPEQERGKVERIVDTFLRAYAPNK